jgi:hypothetical protein
MFFVPPFRPAQYCREAWMAGATARGCRQRRKFGTRHDRSAASRRRWHASVCKNLGKHGFARFRVSRPQKTPVSSVHENLEIQIFKNISLGVSGNLKGLRAKKFGFAFFVLPPIADPVLPSLGVSQNGILASICFFRKKLSQRREDARVGGRRNRQSRACAPAMLTTADDHSHRHPFRRPAR